MDWYYMHTKRFQKVDFHLDAIHSGIVPRKRRRWYWTHRLRQNIGLLSSNLGTDHEETSGMYASPHDQSHVRTL